MMKISDKVISINSPNFDPIEIPVDFLILHHTAASLEDTLNYFLDPKAAVSSHLVIAEDGTIYEVVSCLQGKALCAWHAGISGYELNGVYYEKFNLFSIGIELVNLNGNIHPYPDLQINALVEVTRVLQRLYPKLKNTDRIIGHEQIAGFRGKIDPGKLFPWHNYKTALTKD